MGHPHEVVCGEENSAHEERSLGALRGDCSYHGSKPWPTSFGGAEAPTPKSF